MSERSESAGRPPPVREAQVTDRRSRAGERFGLCFLLVTLISHSAAEERFFAQAKKSDSPKPRSGWRKLLLLGIYRTWPDDAESAGMVPLHSLPNTATRQGRGSSAHRRHYELRPGRALGPAGGDRAHAGEEAHAVRPVHVQRAEQRALPAAEAVKGHRHRDRDVDADHAGLDAPRVFACRSAAAGEHRGAVAVLVAVD